MPQTHSLPSQSESSALTTNRPTPYCRHKLGSTRSRIGESLIRLHQNLEQNRRNEACGESLFDSWQRRWSSRRDQIASRLQMIEEQLERLTGDAGPAARFSIVGELQETDDTIAGRAFSSF